MTQMTAAIAARTTAFVARTSRFSSWAPGLAMDGDRVRGVTGSITKSGNQQAAQCRIALRKQADAGNKITQFRIGIDGVSHCKRVQ